MSKHIQWLAPPPLWQELSTAADKTPFRSPVILRFLSDTFMQDFQNVLRNSPQSLRDYVAQPETWRYPGAGLDYVAPPPALPLKLYQPTHARFYLVASSLTCLVPGLPDHTVNKASGESVSFVVRQLRPIAPYTVADCQVFDPLKCAEYAWIPANAALAGTGGAAQAANGASGSSSSPRLNNQAGWTPATATALATGEEQIPLSISQTGSNGTSRRIFIGLIPASRRQQYFGGPTLPSVASSSGGSGAGSTSSNDPPTDPRIDMLRREVIGPWHNLVDWYDHPDLSPPSIPQPPPVSRDDIAKLASALILYDFSTFLSLNLGDVWTAIGNSSSLGLDPAKTALYNQLSSGLRQALLNANKVGAQLESMGPDNSLPQGYIPYSLTDPANRIHPHTLLSPISAALPPLSSVNVPVLAPIPQKPTINTQGGGDFWFIVRCVYARPQCRTVVVSPPCQPFQLANYFDHDAPARRIQVALPIDTSAAALRKYDRGVAFMLSDELRNQLSRVASLKDLSNGDIGPAGGVNVGWICSLSIPIITICALILLIVIVIALNLVFFWIPFFKICFPVPGLKGKS